MNSILNPMCKVVRAFYYDLEALNFCKASSSRKYMRIVIANSEHPWAKCQHNGCAFACSYHPLSGTKVFLWLLDLELGRKAWLSNSPSNPVSCLQDGCFQKHLVALGCIMYGFLLQCNVFLISLDTVTAEISHSLCSVRANEKMWKEWITKDCL